MIELMKFLMKPLVREILITVALALAIFFVARATIQTYEVYQISMEPSFYQGQRVVVVKAVYWFGDPQRGDVVILESPTNDEVFIKRVIGLPGDTVEVKGGAVYINGFKLNEPYVKNSFSYSMPKEIVPKDNYFVLGDNRDHSNDSGRGGWFLPRENIIGKAWLITWPPSDWSVVPSFNLSEQMVATSNST